MEEIVSKVIPILLLILLGYFIQRKGIVEHNTMVELKKGVVNLALPALLFTIFINMIFREEYLVVIIITFVLLIFLHIVGKVLNKIPKIHHPLLPYVVTGCTFGLLGVPLYGAVFGAENLDKISIIGVGHELFIWFIYYTLMKIDFSKEKFSFGFIKDFIKSPIIIGIVSGILLNISGFSAVVYENPLLTGIYGMIEYLGGLATPLILIIIGYGLKFDKRYMKSSVHLLTVRMLVMLIVGYAFKFLLIDKVIEPDKLFNYAYFTFLILPPPI